MRRTLFSLLLHKHRLTGWKVFSTHFTAVGRKLAEETGHRRLASASVARTTFDRWASGTWYGRPRAEAALILERMFGFTPDVLFSAGSQPEARSSRAAVASGAVAALQDRWPRSPLRMSPTGNEGVWELSGGQTLDGTTAAVLLLPASCDRETAEIHLAPLADDQALDRFLRPARRGLLIGVEDGEDEPRFYAADSAVLRRTAAHQPYEGAVGLPAAYALDDLTFG